jgi:putative flippase GtrA
VTDLPIPLLIPAYQPSSALVDLVRKLDAFRLVPILVINDGSDAKCDSIFEEIRKIPSVTVLEHACNLGKGAALKTGINHALIRYPGASGVITVDADGQHSPEDTRSLRDRFLNNIEALVLGVREFQDKQIEIPLRSRFGNTLTRKVFHLLTGSAVSDTQTGLRAIPRSLLAPLLRVSGSGYEFETDMLLMAIRKKMAIVQHGISTVYIDGNSSSHFNPLLDSLKIYFVLFRFALNSLVSASIDLATFAVTQSMGHSILFSSASGRALSGIFNFLTSKKFVFHSKGSALKELAKYVALVAFMLFISNSAISALVRRLEMNVLLAKILVDGSLFILSFSVQRTFVFARNRPTEAQTDWDAYYSKPFKTASVTRKITIARILDFLSPITSDLKNANCVEFGGGNSCIYESLRAAHPFATYAVLDNNEIGLRLFQERAKKHPNDRGVLGNVLNPKEIATLPSAKLCFSIGLIEHFDEEKTRAAIRSHFACADPGGWVLITYPTPTWLYRLTRGIAELVGVWKFHDERPLKAAEVERELEKHGKILRHEVIWPIFLTQGIVLCQKEST